MTTNYLKLLIESEQISDAPKLVMNESTNLKTLSEGMLYHLQFASDSCHPFFSS